LAANFLRQAVARLGLNRKTLARSAIQAIRVREWRGNVRELEKTIASSALHAHLRASEWVESRDLVSESSSSGEEDSQTLHAATRRCQAQHVLRVLQSTDWNATETARVLDVSRAHVYNLIEKFGLSRE
jgi:DNA-binding NtrC family response regulator